MLLRNFICRGQTSLKSRHCLVDKGAFFVDADNYGSNLLAIAAEPKGAVASMNDHFPVWDIEITLAIEKLV